jgi:flagellar motility protein MotE (MotC chaperone)
MNRSFFNRRRLSARLPVSLFAFICLGLTLLITLHLPPIGGGTIFASQAWAKSAVPPAAADAATSKTAAADVKADDTATSETSDAAASVFQSDPLQSLADALKRKELELQQREATLVEKEHALEVLRLETQQTLERIEQVRRQMESLAVNVDQQHQKQLKKWIEIFQKMAPEKVAPLMIEQEPDFQLELIGQMETAKAAKILNAFPPDKAAELSRKLNR